MDGDKRRTRFENRVELEREFLTCVNRKFGDVSPLAGMTEDAIDSWRDRMRTKIDSAAVERIHHILVEISVRAELIADHSRDVFDLDGRASAGSLDDLRVLLGKILSEAGNPTT
jgi:hypothetical protein